MDGFCSAIGVDIGGSLVKIVVASDVDSQQLDNPFVKYIKEKNLAEIGDTHRGVSVPTAELVQELLTDAKSRWSSETLLPVVATGGGALKYKQQFRDVLGVDLMFVNELQAIVSGCQAHIPVAEKDVLLCNVGTGISLLTFAPGHVNGKFERVSGSGLGGATFWGLVKRLTRYRNFDQAISDAVQHGVAGHADTLVGDIYGHETSEQIGMPADLVAGFLGKLTDDELKDADVVAAILRMVTNNLGQLCVFQAQSLQLSQVWVAGGFVANREVRDAVVEAVKFWSKDQIKCSFLPNPGYLGALGGLQGSSK